VKVQQKFRDGRKPEAETFKALISTCNHTLATRWRSIHGSVCLLDIDQWWSVSGRCASSEWHDICPLDWRLSDQAAQAKHLLLRPTDRASVFAARGLLGQSINTGAGL